MCHHAIAAHRSCIRCSSYTWSHCMQTEQLKKLRSTSDVREAPMAHLMFKRFSDRKKLTEHRWYQQVSRDLRGLSTLHGTLDRSQPATASHLKSSISYLLAKWVRHWFRKYNLIWTHIYNRMLDYSCTCSFTISVNAMSVTQWHLFLTASAEDN